VAALISLAAIAGMRGVATAIGNSFTASATKFSTYTS
jgi:Flp pilus assembly pilin Flp